MSNHHHKHRKSASAKRRARKPLPTIVSNPPPVAGQGVERLHETTVSIFGFGPAGCREAVVNEMAEITELRAAWPVVWVDVEGLANATKLKAIAELFGLHPLALEDVVNRHQRAKLEEYEDHDFIIARMATSTECADTEQIAIFLGKDFVVTMQEGQPGDTLQEVRAKLRQKRGSVRAIAADHLAYSILDAVIDGYFPLLEAYGEQLECIEDQILRRPTTDAVSELHRLKRDLLTLRRTMWSQREVVHAMLRESSPFVSAEARVFLRDVYDHSVRIIELVETFRELGSDLMDLYLSSISNRLNEIMRVLTVISTIFIPLTFIVGVYGMNFDYAKSPWNMPELHWKFGYIGLWGVMIAVAAGLGIYFWRKGWLHSTVTTPLDSESIETVIDEINRPN